ncbi:hypothetical protein LWI29_005285 [Acer saccharum]|uniref:Amino acid transporter transmembrane domain-containing protein n=1 Tax=Acer saccharum TaxID=4024 RepID=A0AA39SIK7_ACESA|nr:hypothetical protein LWI29_005285 [Acer saccharum]
MTLNLVVAVIGGNILPGPQFLDDWEGLRDINNVDRDVYGVNVLADESCRSLIDFQKIVKENLTNVIINIKLAKFGVLGTLEIIEFARKSGLNLMIDSMVETRLATGLAGRLAAGLGCFKYINLDMPFLLPEDQVVGGYEVSGAIYKFINIRGQGRFLEFPAFHNVTAMVGVGVLGLPYAMAQLGWGPGVAMLVLSWVITLYTLWQMVEMHEMVPGRRFDRYHELGQYAFGEKLGLYIVVPQQLIVEVAAGIVFMVTGGKSLKKFHDTVCSTCKDIKLTYFIMIFASVHFVLSHLPNFNSISSVSLAAAAMSLSALGDVAFAYAGHNVVLEIQATIPSTPEKPSKGLMWRGVVVAYIVVAFCYFPVALIGYRMFGNSVEDNILISLEKPAWFIGMANIFVVIHVIGGYQIYAMPVFDMMETVLVTKLNFSPTRLLRFVVRNVYVGITKLSECLPEQEYKTSMADGSVELPPDSLTLSNKSKILADPIIHEQPY